MERMPVQRWRPSVGGLLWVGVWMFPLLDPISTIHTGQGGVVAGVGLGLFMLTYVVTTTLGFDHRTDLSGIRPPGSGSWRRSESCWPRRTASTGSS